MYENFYLWYKNSVLKMTAHLLRAIFCK